MVQPAQTGKGSTERVQSGEYVVRQGECVISISDRAGHYWKTLWNHPANAKLKTARGVPHVLLPSDCLHVPPIENKKVSASTDKMHRFRRKGIPIHLEICVMDNDMPLKGCRYILKIGNRLTEGTIPGDGVIRIPMMPQDISGELRVEHESGEVVYPLLFGHLDPSHTKDGAAARLCNLGRLIKDWDDEVFVTALKKFQKDHGLAISGELDNETAETLSQEHGS